MEYGVTPLMLLSTIASLVEVQFTSITKCNDTEQSITVCLYPPRLDLFDKEILFGTKKTARIVNRTRGSAIRNGATNEPVAGQNGSKGREYLLLLYTGILA